ncbi:MAG: trigger factor [Deltaproteobacteria bacterium]|nr:trigger factor [Deltaproteobacteria bacterium]
MLVSVEELSSVKKTLHIEIPEDIIRKELDKAYEELKKKAKLKGFRPGKVPRGILEQYFRKDVHADVSSKLIQESFLDAIKEKEFKIVGTPKIERPELKVKEPYRYSATIEVRPEIEDIDFRGLKLKKHLYKVSEEEVENQVKMLQRNLAKQEKIEEDRPVAEGDFAVIDSEGFKDQKPMQELSKTENLVLNVGRGQILKEFDDNIIGMLPGEEKEFDVTFPDDFANKDLAGLTVTFKVSLKEIRKEVLPEINDTFAKKLGDYDNLDKLKESIRDNLNREYQKRTEHELNEQIFEQLLAKTDFDVPDSLVEYELENIVSDAERYFAQYDIQMEDAGLTREKISEKYRDLAVKQVKRHLLLSKIIEQEELELSEEDREAGFRQMSQAARQPVEEIKSYYAQNQDRFEAFKQALLEKQAIRLIIDNSVIEEVEVTPDSVEPEAKKTDMAKNT